MPKLADPRTRTTSSTRTTLPRVTRRELLAAMGASAGALAAAALAGAGTSGCRPRHDGVVRIGFMTNLTHAPAIVGLASGRIEQALGVRVESRSFRAGPRVIEALVGDAIDVGVAGPAPVVYTHARHGAGTLRVLSRVLLGRRVVRRRRGVGHRAAPRTCAARRWRRCGSARRRTSRSAST